MVQDQFRECEARLPKFYERFLGGKKAKITGHCHNGAEGDEVMECKIQFWIEKEEQFHCRLEECQSYTSVEDASVWRNGGAKRPANYGEDRSP